MKRDYSYWEEDKQTQIKMEEKLNMKKPVYKYGIEITKPWSKEMYDHNEVVGETMTSNIRKALDASVKNNDDGKFIRIAKYICYYSFGDPWITDDNYNDAVRELGFMPNHILAEDYTDMVKNGLVPGLDVHLIGYEDIAELNALRADPELEASYNEVALSKEDHDEAMRTQGAHK